MLLDHIGMIFGQVMAETTVGYVFYLLFRFLGRLTAPLMCYFLVEGFVHTHSKTNYAIRLAVFAVISQVPYALAHNHSLLTPDFNMIFVLLISFGMLCVWDSQLNKIKKALCLLLLFCLSVFCDWGIFAPLMVMIFYIFAERRRIIIISYSCLSLLTTLASCFVLSAKGFAWYAELWQIGLFLFIPVYFLYNGEPGSRHPFHKWFFYVFYPAHLLVLWGIAHLL